MLMGPCRNDNLTGMGRSLRGCFHAWAHCDLEFRQAWGLLLLAQVMLLLDSEEVLCLAFTKPDCFAALTPN